MPPVPLLPPVSAGPRAVQATFDELGTPLRDSTFVVVDLETTGGSPATAGITEIGAVKVRGGEVLGEFQSLVYPGCGIPPFVAVLTGITDTMVATSPPIEAVLPAFLEFLGDAIVVAHNAPFDVGFLRTACERTGHRWPTGTTVDTAVLARRVLTRDETPDCRLASLARLFRATTAPCHRALADARATVDVLHGLIERLGPLGVHSVEELKTFTYQVSPAQRRKRHLAEPLPHAPGVYLFRDGQGRVLYVGKSKDIRSRVRHYFVSSETRTRMAEMVGVAERVDPIVCAHPLEAEVRELRLIAEHKPRYNRRSRFPERSVYVKLTVEPYPRLSVVRRVHDDGAAYLGPFASRRTADAAIAALHEAVPLRQCTERLSPRRRRAACALAGMGRCGAPCEGGESVEAYAAHVALVRAAIEGDARPVAERLLARIERLSSAHRYESAAAQRDRLHALVRACARRQRLGALTAVPHLVAARPEGGGWDLAVIRHGRLVAAGRVPPGVPPRPQVDALVATAEVVVPGPGPTPCASAEETECLLRWLEQPGTRLVEGEGWCSPAYGAGGLRDLVDAAAAGREAGRDPFGDDRPLRTLARPARATA